MLYLRTALLMCRTTGTEPSFLLHPLDVLGTDNVKELAFFPGMDKTGQYKMKLLIRVLKVLQEDFDLVPMGEHARRIRTQEHIPEKVPKPIKAM